MDEIIKELKSFINDDMQLTALPAKRKKQLFAYYYLATKIDPQRRFSEKEINEVLNRWAVFGDPATLRREMYNKHLLDRTNDCTCYWKEQNIPALEDFIARYI